MAGRIGLGTGPERRAGVQEESPYAAPRSLHGGAAWIAAGTSLLATLALLVLRFGG